MKIKILIPCIFFVNLLFCQNFTLGELINLYNMPSDDFDSYVIKKGFKFNKKYSDDMSKGVQYTTKTNLIAEDLIWDTYKGVIFLFKDASIYLKIKDELKNQSFKLTTCKLELEGKQFCYKKGAIYVELLTTTYSDFGTNYQVTVKSTNSP
jgi:hypothetical protein